MIQRLVVAVIGSCLLAPLGGCQTASEQAALYSEGVPTTPTVQDPTDVQYYASDEPLRLGKEHFGRGSYGLAERYFRDAVEKAPRDATAWVGLAASYDRLRRFDLADQAYAQAIRLTGETVQILNNQGYSLMLRGDLAGARRKFLKSYEKDPRNAVVLNNLELLNSSRGFIQRPPG
jgi:Flp pilus assembly protein TadD